MTHYGHKQELKHVWIPAGQRKSMAAKLQQGVKNNRILNDIRSNVSESFSRVHLVDKQDIKNIASSFDIDEVQRHFNDQDSVLSWIHEWQSSKENPVLFYKMQGNWYSYVCFKQDVKEFLLLTMNNFFNISDSDRA